MKKTTLFLIGMLLVSFNLRPALTGVGPVTEFIQHDLSLTSSVIGILAMLPLLSFGFMSLAAPSLGARTGNSKAILYALILLLIGTALRSAGWISLLFIGTLLVGVGVATGNVLVPSFVKEKFPKKATFLIGVYSAVLSLGASIGSGMTAPLASAWNWQIALGSSGIFVLIALAAWIFVVKHDKAENANDRGKRPPFPWKQPIAWYVTCFMGVQSLLFYSLINWMPQMVADRGVSISTAGTIVMVMQLASLPSNIITPYFAEKYDNQRVLAVVICSIYLIGVLGIFFLPSTLFWLYVSAIIIGVAQGGSICLALLLINLRAKTPSEVMVLSGMSQSFGYFIAAIGPLAFGIMKDATGTWGLVQICLLATIIIFAILGWFAGRNEYIQVRSSGMDHLIDS
ncbi:CynX/NimT family MFS transporter [Bacillus sp. 1P06AnD]|uniref:CynX/NimT family MFS transporter n=1 Tax=Bacillus sp. 1P06AnD TaxID=3132208 RepID=UPI0039A0C8FA